MPRIKFGERNPCPMCGKMEFLKIAKNGVIWCETCEMKDTLTKEERKRIFNE